jgi:phage shock protein E
MHWTSILIVAAGLAIFLFLKRAGLVSAKNAQAYLADGALLIDVRTPGEFAAHHLPHAINLPLDQIESTLPRRVKNKSQTLLLYCQSGMRSAAAKKKLHSLGYSNAFNLGSYSRAAHIAGSK